MVSAVVDRTGKSAARTVPLELQLSWIGQAEEKPKGKGSFRPPHVWLHAAVAAAAAAAADAHRRMSVARNRIEVEGFSFIFDNQESS